MFCTKCGNQVSDTAVFCTKCGNKIKKVTPNVPEPVIQDVPKVDYEAKVNEEHNKAVLAEARAIEAEKARRDAESKAEEKAKEVEAMKAAEEARLESERLAKEAEKNKRSDLENALNNMQNRQKRCPHCGALVLNESQYCKNCGSAI